jgi:hypothetical protein
LHIGITLDSNNIVALITKVFGGIINKYGTIASLSFPPEDLDILIDQILNSIINTNCVDINPQIPRLQIVQHRKLRLSMMIIEEVFGGGRL